MADAAGNPRTEKDLGTGAAPIIAQIDAYEECYQGWTQRGKNIVRRYRDVRMGTAQQPLNPLVLRKFNILWSNVETLKPTLYARLPKIIVEREYKDADPIARIACEIAERAGNWTLRKTGFDYTMRQCVNDRLLPGRAVAWVDYQVEGDDVPVMATDPTTGAQVPQMGPDGKPAMQFQKRSEKAVPIYVDWDDFGHSPVRTWEELDRDGYIWRKVYMDEDACKKRFPAAYTEGRSIPLDRKPENTKDKTDTVIPQATIYVVYCKRDKMIYWVHKQMEELLDSKPPAVDLEGFWPCPRPLFATMTNETLEPVPDFYYYQDQADLLDKIINRMSRIVDAMKVAGVYDKAVGALQNIFHPNGAPDNILVPVDNWAAFAEKGGINAAFQLAPIDMFVEGYNSLAAAAQQVLEVIYQVTGISDIIRGSSDPNETATAQGIKSQFASLRIKDTQAEVARFSRDLAAMLVEIIVENYDPKYIWDMTNAQSFCVDPQTKQPSPEMFQQALMLLKNQRMRDFRIDIETDSTIALDDEAEKAAASEFVKTVGEFMAVYGPLVEAQPALGTLAGEMLEFLARRYRAGRSMETTIEQTMAQVQQSLAKPKPDPEVQKAQAQIQIEQMKAQSQAQLRQQQAQMDSQLEQQKMQAQLQHEAAQAQADMAVQRQKAELEMELMRREAALKFELAAQESANKMAVANKSAERRPQ